MVHDIFTVLSCTAVSQFSYFTMSDSLSRLSTILKIGNRENVAMFTLDRIYVTRHHIDPQMDLGSDLGL